MLSKNIKNKFFKIFKIFLERRKMEIFEIILIYILITGFTIFGNAISLAESKHLFLWILGIYILWGIIITIIYYSIY